MILFRLFGVFAGLITVSASSASERVDLKKAVQEVIRAERGYDKLAQEKNFAAASVQVFAEDGVAFAPGPVNGKKYWAEQKDPPLLTWRPVFATISRSGDLGFTTGPWEFRKAKGDAKPAAFGHYNTLWRKGADGVWKAALDLGIGHPEPPKLPAEVETFVPESPPLNAEAAQTRFDETEKSFAEMLVKDASAAVLAKASDRIRVYRNGIVPAVGRSAAKNILDSDQAKETRTRLGGGKSQANDLAFSYGNYSSTSTGAMEQGVYFSIWQLDSNNDWKLVLDLHKKAPAQ